MKKIRVPVPKHSGIFRIKFQDEEGKLHSPKRGAAFEARISINGKPHSFACLTLDEAKEIRYKKNAPVKEVAKADPTDLTFLQAVQRWRESYLPHLARATRNKYEFSLAHFTYFLPFKVSEIGPTEVLGWLASIKTPSYLATQKSTRSSYHYDYLVLRGIFNHYRDTYNQNYRLPFIKAHMKLLKVREVPKKQKDLSMKEFQEFLGALKARTGKTKEVFYYLALFQYGIYGRIQEAAALHFEDFSKGEVHVHRKVEWPRRSGQEALLTEGTKTNSGKVLPMSRFLNALLKEWKEKTGRTKGLLFTYKGEILSYRRIQYLYDLALKDAGVNFTGTHLLRHASLTEVYHQSKDIKTTALLAGHASVVTTQRYAKTRSEQVKETQERMGEELLAVL